MDIIRELQNPEYVARVQRFLGIVPVSEEQNGATEQNSPGRHRINGEHREIRKKFTNTEKNGIVKNVDNNNSKFSDAGNVRRISTGNGDVTCIVRYRILHYVFHLASLLGNEPFYLLFYPLIGWNADFYLTRVTAILWCVVMYMGQATKDVVRWPRPSYPPVVTFENTYILEYGMPSTHAMAGTAMPFTLLYFIASRYDVSVWPLLCIAIPWSGLVCVSRLYLGVHTVGDVVVGVVYSAVIMAVMLPWLGAFDAFQQTNPAAPFVLFVLALLLCTKLYPSNAAVTAKDDSANIVAVVYGMTLGVWINYNLGITRQNDFDVIPYAIHAPTLKWIGLSVLRLVIGAAAIAVSKVTLKAVTVPVISRLLGHGGSAEGRKNETVLQVYRFITYITLGVVIAHVVPVHIFHFLGIDRAGFYLEAY